MRLQMEVAVRSDRASYARGELKGGGPEKLRSGLDFRKAPSGGSKDSGGGGRVAMIKEMGVCALNEGRGKRVWG